MAEISRNTPSDIVSFTTAPKQHKDSALGQLNDGEATFREAVQQLDANAQKPKSTKKSQTHIQQPQNKSTRKAVKPDQPAQPETNNTQSVQKELSPKDIKKNTTEEVKSDAAETVLDLPDSVELFNITSLPIEAKPIEETDSADDLSDLTLPEDEMPDNYTVNDYQVTDKENQESSEIIVFARELHVAAPVLISQTNKNGQNNELQTKTDSLDVQPMQSSVDHQNIHENHERHLSDVRPDRQKSTIELSPEEQKAVDAFINAKESIVREKSPPIINIVPTNIAAPQAEIRRSLFAPIQLAMPLEENTGSSTTEVQQIDPLSNTQTTKGDKGGQESMNFSQFSNSSSDAKNMAETNKVVTHNLVSTNPAAEFIETLKQNFKQFSKVNTSKLTVQMRHSGKNLTIHFNIDADDVMNVTFRTTDKDWKQMLQNHSNDIENAFVDSNHAVKIKYLGE